MSRTTHSDERQLSLNFNVKPIQAKNLFENNVVSLQSFKTRSNTKDNASVLNRLLQEAQKIKW